MISVNRGRLRLIISTILRLNAYQASRWVEVYAAIWLFISASCQSGTEGGRDASAENGAGIRGIVSGAGGDMRGTIPGSVSSVMVSGNVGYDVGGIAGAGVGQGGVREPTGEGIVGGDDARNDDGIAGSSGGVEGLGGTEEQGWTPPAGKTLVWADEFDGSTLDTSKWVHETGATGWGNNEWENYTDSEDNSYIENSTLVIEAIKTTGGKGGYTSARIITKGKYQFTYGVVAAKIRLPYGQGIWPAFWLLGANIDQVSWPSCGEIDVMEMVGGAGDNDSTVNGALHWGEPGSQRASYGESKTLAAPLHESWHYFEAVWSSSNIQIKVDGIQYFTMSTSGSEKDEFRQPFFILFNLAIGGNWPGYPDSSTVFPQQMAIDWVRVYQ